MRPARFPLLGLAVATLAMAQSLEAQGIVEKMKERARQQAAGRANRAADEAVDSAASIAERSVRCLISDSQCIKAAQEAGQPVIVTGADGTPVSSEDSAAAVVAADSLRLVQPPSEWEPSGAPATPEPLSVTARHEAASLVTAVDFSRDQIGAPPQSVQVNQGTFTVEEDEVEDGRWITGKERGGGSFFLPLPGKLPPVFTLTFDVLGGGGMIGVHPSGVPTGAHAMVETSGLGLIDDGRHSTKAGSIPERLGGVVHHAKVVGRDSTLMLYIDGTRVAEATSAALARRGKRIAFGMSVYGSPIRIGSIRVVEGAE